MQFEFWIARHIEWSLKTFGAGKRTEGICKHIESELAEIRADPEDPREWIDVIILAVDGAWRAGLRGDEILQALWDKQKINRERQWKQTAEDEPSFHVQNR